MDNKENHIPKTTTETQVVNNVIVIVPLGKHWKPITTHLL